jgi:predicted lipid carrier protein YhbT
MPDPTVALFDWLGSRGHDPALEQIVGTIRFDLATDAEILHWMVRVEKGDVSVSRSDEDADCVVFTTKARLDEVAAGRANAMAMLLRAEVIVHGNIELLVALERLLPGPPGARGPRSPAGAGDRR